MPIITCALATIIMSSSTLLLQSQINSAYNRFQTQASPSPTPQSVTPPMTPPLPSPRTVVLELSAQEREEMRRQAICDRENNLRERDIVKLRLEIRSLRNRDRATLQLRNRK